MLKRNSKAMAIVITLFFCFAFVAPAFVSPDVAQAAGTYRALSAPIVGSTTTEDLGVIEIDFPSGAEVKNGDVLTVSFPSKVTASAPAGGAAVTVTSGAAAAAQVSVVVPTNHPLTGIAQGFNAANITATMGNTSQSMNITFNADGAFARSVMYVYLNSMTMNGASGDLTATIMGSKDTIPLGNVVVGKVSTETGTMATIKGVTSIGTAATTLEPITLIETKKNSLVSGEVVKVKLPAGFRWTGVFGPGAQANWAFSAAVGYPAAVDDDNRVLNITLNNIAGGFTTTGRIDVIGIIQADDSVAKKGDVIAHIYSDQGNVTEQDITVAKYGTFAANGEEGTVAELIAGKAEQKLGTFFITEELPGSIVPGRTIKLTLPVGMKWWGGYRTGTIFPAPVYDAGNNIIGGNTFTVAANSNNSSDEGRSITLTLATPGSTISTTAAKIKFKDFKVDVSPKFSGDATVTIAGTAGAVGEVKIATVKPPVELSVENATKVRIGEQKQLAGDLIIKETKKDNIAFRNTEEWVDTKAGVQIIADNNRPITLTLPIGAQWAELPKVEITEGDLQLDINNMSKGSAVLGGADNRRITIPVKSGSMTASTVKVSDILVTLDRTVPEGDFKIGVGGLAVNEVPDVFPNDSLPGQVVSTVITPAPDEGTDGAASGIFRIDSNIYEVNGVSKVMDAAPYIKANRTYVPVRYLAYALGVAEADVVWDEATKKATLTKGDNVVELTIGSTTITVNGEAQTMDVAPEITNNRTMLPARYVAEGLGYVVGWDPGTRTVLISK